jgi:hypothetical protein
MKIMLDKAKLAASQVADDVDVVTHRGNTAAGEQLFDVRCRGGRQMLVTLNPNGLSAAVEWRSRDRGRSGYRVFRLSGLVSQTLVSKTLVTKSKDEPPEAA